MAIGRIPEPGTGIPESIVDAKGDIVTATAADTPARLAVGTNDYRLVAASGEATGLKYVADTQNTVADAKGDLLVGTGADTIARLAVGTNGHTLVADSAETTGLKWAAPGGSAADFTLLNAGGTALTGAQDITVSGISGKETIMLYVVGASSANASSSINVRINGLSTSVYNAQGIAITNPTSYNKAFLDGWDGGSDNKINLAIMSDAAASTVRGYVLFQGCNSSGVKVFQSAAGVVSSTGKDAYALSLGGYVTAAAITSVTLRSDSGNFDAGTLFVYAA